MSIVVLRDLVRQRLRESLEGATSALVQRREDTLDQLRFQQGRAAGLQEAIDTLDTAVRDMH